MPGENLCRRVAAPLCLTYSLMQKRTHIERPYVFLMYDYFHFWNTIPWSPTFFPAAWKECRPRKGAPPRVSGLNFETPAYVRATRSLRSLKHGAAASRRRSQNFPLRGRPPTERAGKLYQYWTYIVHEVRLHVRCGRFAHTDAEPHREAVRVSHVRPFPFWECDSMIPSFSFRA